MKELKNLKDALEYCESMSYNVEEVNIKHQIYFQDSKEPFNFCCDEALIDWCEEDRQKVEEVKNE